MNLTTNLELKKPEYTDPVDIKDLNENMDKIDETLEKKVDKTQVLTNVPAGAKFTDTVYTHPSKHPMSMITGLTDELSKYEQKVHVGDSEPVEDGVHWIDTSI